jgi:salicylate hydroxylase
MADSMPERAILVAGGGIGGLAAALALAQRGRRVHVLERHNKFSEAGAGIQIGPNGVHALRKLGLEDQLSALAARPEYIAIVNGATGEAIAQMPLGDSIARQYGTPYLVAHRADLHDILLTAAQETPDIEISTGFEIVELTQDDNTVTVTAGDGRLAEADLLIGADGQRSDVRALLGIASKLTFAGKTAARTTVDVERLPAPFTEPATGLWLGRRAHVVHYPIQRGRAVAFVVITDDDWQGDGWSAPVEANTLAGRLEGFAPNLRSVVAGLPDWRKWALFDAEPLSSWGYGRVALLGDAAHPVLPFLAQGAVLALEDAVTLGDAVARNQENLPNALVAYEAARLIRAWRVQRASRMNGMLYHLPQPLAGIRNAIIRGFGGQHLLARYDWLYGWRGAQK